MRLRTAFSIVLCLLGWAGSPLTAQAQGNYGLQAADMNRQFYNDLIQGGAKTYKAGGLSGLA